MAAQGLRHNFSNQTGSSEALGCRMGKYVIGGEPPKIQKLHAVITRALPGRGWEFVMRKSGHIRDILRIGGVALHRPLERTFRCRATLHQ